MKYDHDYPFSTWEEQFEELKEVYADGGISDEFIDFATSNGFKSTFTL